MTVDAKEEIEFLQQSIRYEEEWVEIYAAKVDTAQKVLNISLIRLNKLREKLAAELSQVGA